MFASLTIRIPVWLDKICVWPLMLYRRLTYGQPYRRIYLGEGAYTIVDPDVYYEKCGFRWFLSNGTKAYPARTIKIGHRKIRRSFLHREIVKPRKGKLVDHRDNDAFNNLRSNLREATHSQNAMNRPKIKKKTSSKYIGVSWEKSSNKWHVKIEWRKNGRLKRKTIGYFDKDKEIDAARAYDIAAIKYHKRFARLNFPREDYVRTRNGYKFAGERKKSSMKKKSWIYNLFRHGLTRINTVVFYLFTV
ncbi:MAG: AP2 domain-containing protein [Sedimentisphaerales bacterium]